MSTAASPRPLSFFALATIALLSACQSAERATERCRTGSLEDCERSCELGHFGYDGCLRAAAAAAALSTAPDAGPASRQRALGLYEKACQGAEVEGCQELVLALNAPLSDVAGSPERATEIMDDATLARRERALVRACELDASWCDRLGAAMLGVNEARAREALTKACVDTATRDGCAREAQRLAASAEKHRKDCEDKRTYACPRLERIVFRHDPARVTRLVKEHCIMRDAVDPNVCLAESVEIASGSGSEFGEPKPLSNERLDELIAGKAVRLGEVTGISKQEAEALFEQQLRAPVLACYDAGLRNDPNLQGRVTARWVVDAMGYPWALSNGGSDLPDVAVLACVMQQLLELHTGLSKGRRASIQLLFGPP